MCDAIWRVVFVTGKGTRLQDIRHISKGNLARSAPLQQATLVPGLQQCLVAAHVASGPVYACYPWPQSVTTARVAL